MTVTKMKTLALLFPLLLLAACEEGGQASEKTGSDMSTLSGVLSTADLVQQTQSGAYLAAQFAQYRQDWDKASSYLDKAMKYDPGNIQLQQQAMVLAMQSGDSTRAIMLARKVLENDRKNTLALLFVAVDHIARQEYKAAENLLEDMPRNGIADFIKPLLIAWMNAAEGDIDLDFMATGGPLQAYHAFLISDYRGKVKDLERFFMNIVASGGADAHTLEKMGDVAARQGKTNLAKEIYKKLLEEGRDDPSLISRITLIEEKLNNPAAAMNGRMQTPAQGAAEAFYNMARILFNDKSDESAIVFSRLAMLLDPAKDEAKIITARMMARTDHRGDAIALFQSIRADSPYYLESLRSAADIFEMDGQTEQAIAMLEEAFAGGGDVRALIQIGDVYRRAERFEESIAAYNRAEAALGGKISSDHWNLLYARGMSYERAGNMKKAEADLKAALEFRPDHPYLLNYLGYSWADQGKNLSESLALIEKAVALKPDDGYIIDSLGWVFYKMGNFEQAVAELEKAVELVPYDPTINDHLGDAYWQVGRKNEARFQWQRALNHAGEDMELKASLETKIANGIELKEPAVMQARTNAPGEDATANP